MSIRLVIKGNVEEAQKKALELGIELSHVRGLSLGAVFADTDREHEEKVVRWFLSDLGPDGKAEPEGYEQGSLLHYKF